MDDSHVPRVWVSAQQGEGIAELRGLLAKQLSQETDIHDLHIPASAGKLRASLYEHGSVQEEEVDAAGGWMMKVSLERDLFRKLCHRHKLQDSILN